MSKGMTRDMTAKNLWKIGLFHDTFITKTGRQNRKKYAENAGFQR